MLTTPFIVFTAATRSTYQLLYQYLCSFLGTYFRFRTAPLVREAISFIVLL